MLTILSNVLELTFYLCLNYPVFGFVSPVLSLPLSFIDLFPFLFLGMYVVTSVLMYEK